MSNNILKNIIFIPILGVLLVNFNLRAEENEEELTTEVLEQNLIELEELKTIQNTENIEQNNSSYFPNFDKAILLQDDDKKEIRASKTQEIGKYADLIFNIREEAKNNFKTIVIKNQEGKTEGPDQNGMKDLFNKIEIQGKPLNSKENKVYREALYLSLDWDKNLLNKFKEQLKNTIEFGTKLLHAQMVEIGINIQINSEVGLKTICCKQKAKKTLYNKLDAKQLESIKAKVNAIMNLRKEWIELINTDNTIFDNMILQKSQKVLNNMRSIKKEIQKILENQE